MTLNAQMSSDLGGTRNDNNNITNFDSAIPS